MPLRALASTLPQAPAQRSVPASTLPCWAARSSRPDAAVSAAISASALKLVEVGVLGVGLATWANRAHRVAADRGHRFAGVGKDRQLERFDLRLVEPDRHFLRGVAVGIAVDVGELVDHRRVLLAGGERRKSQQGFAEGWLVEAVGAVAALAVDDRVGAEGEGVVAVLAAPEPGAEAGEEIAADRPFHGVRSFVAGVDVFDQLRPSSSIVAGAAGSAGWWCRGGRSSRRAGRCPLYSVVTNGVEKKAVCRVTVWPASERT